MKVACVLLGVIVVMSGCVSRPPVSGFANLPDSCGEGFFPRGSHFSDQIDEPFRVQVIAGLLTNTGGVGWWPEVRAHMAVRPARRRGPILNASTDLDGRFRFPRLPDGVYCFQVWAAPGWQTYYGTVVVTRSAPTDARIAIEISIDY